MDEHMVGHKVGHKDRNMYRHTDEHTDENISGHTDLCTIWKNLRRAKIILSFAVKFKRIME